MRGSVIVFLFFMINSILLQQYCYGNRLAYVKGADDDDDEMKRSDFPSDFLFGAATSAYQIEGGYLEDGKSLSNWDVFTRIPGGIDDGENADVADDHYHRYMEDIDIMESLGVNSYRFSISWSRILPRGRIGKVNVKAVEFYSKIIDSLILRGIKPFVTLHHFELPHELEEKHNGWLNPIIQEEFVAFAETCFHHFGDRVKHWATMNEPTLVAELAYLKGLYPPSHCSPPYGNCTSGGNSDLEPLLAIHNMILAHCKATLLYRTRYQPTQHGQVGIVTVMFMYKPYREDNPFDIQAVERALAFEVGWVLDPIVYGEYPDEMRQCHGKHMPRFSEEEVELVRKAVGVDFIGVNHYTSLYAKDCLHSVCKEPGANRAIKGFVEITGEGADGLPIGERTGMSKFFVVPDGMEKAIDYISGRYPSTPIFITENGYAEGHQAAESTYGVLNDQARIEYHKSYMAAMGRSIWKGADVKGYFVWSLMDNFEWLHGYNVRFGLYYVNRTTLSRLPKLSADWYSKFLHDEDNNEVGVLSFRSVD